MIRRPDRFGIALVLSLAAALLGAGDAVVVWGLMTPWDLLLVAGAGAVMIAAHRPRPASSNFQNTFAHGAARLAREHETHAASGGANKVPELHDQTFDE